jgi:PEP-CTERM motif
MTLKLPQVAALVAAAGLALPATAATIGHPSLTASTSLGQYLGFSIDQMVDGITADSPFNGYASGFGSTSGRITLTLDALYTLESFSLWNDINILNEGVRSFTLSFEGAGGVDLGTTGVFTAVSQFAAQVYSFAAVASVQRVHLDVLTSNLQIEIREVAFNGERSGTGGTVPEPASLLLAAAALAAAAGASRVSARK